MQFILDGVGRAFSGPVSDIGDIRRCMARTMLVVVFGAGQAPAPLAGDVQRLFGYVQNPGRRFLFGWSQAARRRRLYHELRRLWRGVPASGAPSLIAVAKGMAHDARLTEEELIQQIPHWMFTFTGSGTDLLARTLGVVASRDEVCERVRAEALEQGSTGRVSAIVNMEYLESCLLETCRLFPPVARTFHVAPRGDMFDGVRIPAGLEILHFFTASQRDLSVDATADDFRPERWMEPGSSARAIYPSLFLGGARDCPGRTSSCSCARLPCRICCNAAGYGRNALPCPKTRCHSPFPREGFGSARREEHERHTNIRTAS
jgi:cytochrome P450